MHRILLVGAAMLALSTGAGRATDPAAEVDFVTRAAAGDLLAAAESRLAVERAADPKVRDFARLLVAERGGDEAALRAAAEGSGAMMPKALDATREARLAALRNLSGPAFDRGFLADQAEIHSNALTLYGDYMLLGENAALKALAIRMIPVEQAEYRDVQALSPP